MTISLRSRHTLSFAAVALLLSAATVTFTAAAPGASRVKRPTVKFGKTPPSRTTSTTAEFRFRTGARSVACRRDDQRYRRCRSRVRYRNLRPGRHTFTIRLRHRGRTAFVRRRWTVLPRAESPRRPAPIAPIAPVAPTPPAPVAPPPGPPAVVAPPPVPAPSEGASSPRRLIFSDDFDGSALDPAVWDIYDGPGHAGQGLRKPSAFSLDGAGNLVVTASMLDDEIVSGGMKTRLTFTYGRVEFRVRTEPDPTGTMSAVMLTWPAEQWAPEFTENDIYETGPIANNTHEFSSFIHFGTNNWQKWATHHYDPSQWHTVAMEWHPDRLEIYVDGTLGLRIDDPFVIPDVLHHMCIQLDARAPQALTRPVRMFVDYVRIFE